MHEVAYGNTVRYGVLRNQIFYRVSHRLRLHPLAKSLGPWQAAITNGYAALVVWRGDSHVILWGAHWRYGVIEYRATLKYNIIDID